MVNRRTFTKASALASLGAFGAVEASDVTVAQSESGSFIQPAIDVSVSQSAGGTAHFMTPGKRPLGQFTFGGGEEAPRVTATPWIERSEGAVRAVLEEIPFLQGAPPSVREANDPPVGQSYDPALAPQRTAVVTPFPQGAEIDGETLIPEIDGAALSITYRDRQRVDTGVGGDTDDDIAADTIQFEDPDGTPYRFEVTATVQPPWPTWETGGGVFTTAWMHGPSLIGTPLQPFQFVYGAAWGLGDMYVDGELRSANENRAVHLMTSQAVRKADNYELALTAELPLEDPYLGRETSTHAIFPPIQVTDEGPTVQPFDQDYNDQPFLHVVYDEATIDGIEVLVDGGGDDGGGNGDDGGGY